MDQQITPMMKQYRENKSRHPDAVLLFRMGDFYELFFDDAKKASKILGIALTTRDKNKEEGVPMCGFPHHSASAYISKLLQAGERVAVCDQIEDPKKAKGLVKREITRVLTPGLTEEPSTLITGENHFIASVADTKKVIGIAAFDLSTGDLLVTTANSLAEVVQELARLNAKEILLNEKETENSSLMESIKREFYVHSMEEWSCDPKNCSQALVTFFDVQNLEGFGFSEGSVQAVSLGMILNYVKLTRSEAPVHIKYPRSYRLDNYMALDPGTLRNLEIFGNLKNGGKEGTLISVLDKTSTAMGTRLLRLWMNYPLLEKAEIRRRSEAIEALLESSVKRTQISESLHDIADLERIAGKISLRNITPRDLIHLKTSAENLPGLLERIDDMKTELLEEISSMDDLAYVAHAIGAMIVDSPPAVIRDGGVIRSGFNAEVDELRSLSREGKQWIAKIEETERSATGIPNLKIGYNKVFGYFIEVSKSYQQKVPAHYIRKQTLVNAERYITEDLKEYELKVINAQERIVELEEELFNQLRTKLLEVIPRIQDTAKKLAILDVLTSLAQTAASRSYCKPEVNDSDVISIEEGRHPVVETFDDRESYVANDTFLSNSTHQILLITGPNMAGKSTYMRQTALIVIMAQMGGFVPAKNASIGVVDRIFTRIGAADYLAFGQSTFMVEMNETADIVHNATSRSLVLLDEIGRGTSTFDGLSIAWAVTEYLHDKVDGPRTMFATHYHELTDIARIRDRVKNFFIEVREWGDKIVFIRKIVQGVAGRSYGIQVAKLAGIPQPVIDRAKEILSNLEKEELDLTGKPRIARKKNKPKDQSETMQTDLFGYRADELVSEIHSIDPNNLTPIQALNLISDWKRRLDT